MSAAFPVLAKDSYTGKRYGRFEVLCKLGEGGMSEVFLAFQTGVGGFRRPVVLKRILDSIRHQEDFLRMFVREAKIHSSLSHGNIAALHDLAKEDGQLFMVIEFVAGATLVEVAKACAMANTAIPIGLTLSTVYETAQALQYAHTFVDTTGRRSMVVHRDVAEKNIMVGFDGKTKLLDFGIARQEGAPAHTQVGLVKGTAGYMSPEQVRGEPLDGRSDVFSLGVVLHECLTGQRLFKRANRADEVHALLTSPIPPPSARNPKASMQLDSIVLKALSREREHRYTSAKELGQALLDAAAAQFWDEERRSRFIAEHFTQRQHQIQQLLGDPLATNLDDLLDDPHTVNIRVPAPETAAARETNPVTLQPVRETNPISLPPVHEVTSPHSAPISDPALSAEPDPSGQTLIADPDEVRRAVARRENMPERTVSAESVMSELTPEQKPRDDTADAVPVRRGRSRQLTPMQRLQQAGFTQPMIFAAVGLGAVVLALLLLLLIK
ncbi:MAG: serine/threonine-protein kinase [Myxococcaceae bacterium]